MSRNNTDAYNPIIADVRGMLDERAEDYPSTRPIMLAFSEGGKPGADPAPGKYDGHGSWADNLQVHSSVEEVRHFVAAHEIRNSFPLESIGNIKENRIKLPSHFYESIYPGAHSDVGGGYAPGEGGRSSSPYDSLSLIPLRHMYNFAIRKGVPMLNETQWIADDFKANEKLCDDYNKYMKVVGAASNLGEGVNKHMKMFHSWRSRKMKISELEQKKHDDSIREFHVSYKNKAADYEPRLKQLKTDSELAETMLAAQEAMHRESLRSSDDVKRAKDLAESKKHLYLKTKAEFDAIPDMSKALTLAELYDLQLRVDIQTIRSAMTSKYGAKKESDLRPHYKGLINAFKTTIPGNVALDMAVVNMFDKYVHDSLSGFGKDATYPSDPRVIYIGDDEKLPFAEASFKEEDKMNA